MFHAEYKFLYPVMEYRVMKNSIIRLLRRTRRLRAAKSPRSFVFTRGCTVLTAAVLLFSGCASDGSQGRSGGVSNPTLFVEGSKAETSMLVTTENGGTDSFLVRLGEEPLAEVTLSITGIDPTEAQVEPDTLTFDSENWEAGQTVTVIGLDDDEHDGSQNLNLYLDASGSGDELYVTMTVNSLPLVNVDNDAPGVTVIDGTLEFWEHGGRGHFWIVLNTPPDDTVGVTVGCTVATEALIVTDDGTAADSAELVFTPENWATPQRVGLLGQDDALSDGNQIFDLRVSVNAQSTLDSTGYLDVAPEPVTIIVKDGETSGVYVYLARGCWA
jgi:hypothetical protein